MNKGQRAVAESFRNGGIVKSLLNSILRGAKDGRVCVAEAHNDCAKAVMEEKKWRWFYQRLYVYNIRQNLLAGFSIAEAMYEAAGYLERTKSAQLLNEIEHILTRKGQRIHIAWPQDDQINIHDQHGNSITFWI